MGAEQKFVIPSEPVEPMEVIHDIGSSVPLTNQNVQLNAEPETEPNEFAKSKFNESTSQLIRYCTLIDSAEMSEVDSRVIENYFILVVNHLTAVQISDINRIFKILEERPELYDLAKETLSSISKADDRNDLKYGLIDVCLYRVESSSDEIKKLLWEIVSDNLESLHGDTHIFNKADKLVTEWCRKQEGVQGFVEALAGLGSNSEKMGNFTTTIRDLISKDRETWSYKLIKSLVEKCTGISDPVLAGISVFAGLATAANLFAYFTYATNLFHPEIVIGLNLLSLVAGFGTYIITSDIYNYRIDFSLTEKVMAKLVGAFDMSLKNSFMLSESSTKNKELISDIIVFLSSHINSISKVGLNDKNLITKIADNLKESGSKVKLTKLAEESFLQLVLDSNVNDELFAELQNLALHIDFSDSFENILVKKINKMLHKDIISDADIRTLKLAEELKNFDACGDALLDSLSKLKNTKFGRHL